MSVWSPAESWKYQLRHYANLEAASAWPGVVEYHQLVEVIAKSRFADRLYALRSHDFLRVSPTSGWVSRGPKWVDRPWVLLRPLQSGQVALTFRGGPSELTADTECEFSAAWGVLEPWLEWLATKA
jgi:hypothetical protein